MWSMIMLVGWASFALCGAWCLTSVKRNTSITFSDAKMIWILHRKSANCTGHKWQPITRRKGKIIGFECECGYEYTQKRPLVSRIPKAQLETHNEVPNVGNKIGSLR
jgi:hypothetical protein